MKRIKLLGASLIICVMAVLAAVYADSSFNTTLSYEKPTSKNSVATAAENTESLFSREIETVDDLYNFDDSNDYISVEYAEGGYAVFYKPTMELLEYSAMGEYPYKDMNGKKYYNGPANYFIKQNDDFLCLTTGKELKISDQERSDNANKIRATFSRGATVQKDEILSQVSLNKNSPPPFDNDTMVKPDYSANYISNKEYFLSGPYHGENRYETCGSVAAHILLNYNNYYNDRRIIPDQYLFSGEDNPNTCSDPMSMNRKVLGSTDEYYNKLIKEIEPNHNGSLLMQVKNGISTMLDSRNIDYSINKKRLAIKSIPSSEIINELKADRPLVVSLEGRLGGTSNGKSGHDVVAYGYQDYTYKDGRGTYTGYVAHFGWSDNTYPKYAINVWVNSAWCDGYITLKINHTHDYAIVGGDYHECKCVTCGHRSNIYKTRSLGNSNVEISGLRVPLTGELMIPEMLNGKNVTIIGEGSFANQTGLTKVTLPACVTSIEDRAFYGCSSLKSFIFPENNLVTRIGSYAFASCTKLFTIMLPIGLTKLEDGTFSKCESLVLVGFYNDCLLTKIGSCTFYGCNKLIRIKIPSGVTILGISAFENCTALSNVEFSEDSKLFGIGVDAFKNCVSLKELFMPTKLIVAYDAFTGCSALESLSFYNSAIVGYAFQGCDNLTIYNSNSSKNSGIWWSEGIPDVRPVVWDCDFSADFSYVVSVTKTADNPTNINAANGIKNPARKNYDFAGWYTDSSFSGTKYNDLVTAPEGKLYAKWVEPSCVAEGSLITLADGTQKTVENLTGSEQLLVWNLFTGKFDSAPILFIDSDPASEYEVINLTFSDGTIVKVIDEHAFWDFNLNKYVFLRSDAAKYIGHWFNKQTTDADGNMAYTRVQLTDVDVRTEYTTAWSPVTYGHLCYYVNGMLSMPGATTGLINIFDVDPDTMKIDETKYNADIAKYGLFTYEEFAAIYPVPENIFEAFGGQYLKVAIGKGLLTEDMLNSLIIRYTAFFVD